MTLPAAITPRKRAVIVDTVGNTLTFNAGKTVTESRLIELAITHGVEFDLPNEVVIARGSGKLVLQEGETITLNAGELVLKLDSTLIGAIATDKRIRSVQIGKLTMKLESAGKS
jgi:hypothetical protein